MKAQTHFLFAAVALTVMGLTVIGCQQAPAASPAASAPPATTTVIEDVHRGHDDGDAHKMQGREHALPGDASRQDHSEEHQDSDHPK